MCNQFTAICVPLLIQPGSTLHLIYLSWGDLVRHKLKVEMYNLGMYLCSFVTNLFNKATSHKKRRFIKKINECRVTQIGNGRYLAELDLANLPAPMTLCIFLTSARTYLIMEGVWNWERMEAIFANCNVNTFGRFCLCVWLSLCFPRKNKISLNWTDF